MTPINPIIITILGAVIIILGILLLILHFFFLTKNLSTANWLKTSGDIIDSKIEINSNIFNQDYEKFYNAKVVYKYSVKNKQYISKRIFWGDIVFSPYSNNKNKIIDKYPAGQTIPVYYNPTKHNVSVLEKGIRLSNIVNISLTLGCIIIGITILNEKELIIEGIKNFLQIGNTH